MKFTGIAVSLALAGVDSSAALPTVPGISTAEGALAGTTGAVEGLTAGIAGKRQLDAVQPITESAASSLNGVTGVTGSAVGTVASTVGGAAGTVENGVTGALGGRFFLPNTHDGSFD